MASVLISIKEGAEPVWIVEVLVYMKHCHCHLDPQSNTRLSFHPPQLIRVNIPPQITKRDFQPKRNDHLP